MPSPATVTYTTTIDATPEAVWHVLAVRFGEIEQISDGVARSRYLSDQVEGVGTARRCDLADGGFMEERVSVWEPPHTLGLVIDATSMPMASGSALTFTLSPRGPAGTEVRVDGTYRLARLGLLSGLARPMVRRVVAGILDDLEQAV
ncbi:MAG: SRPBCC family protein [Actinomycetota bacterium]